MAEEMTVLQELKDSLHDMKQGFARVQELNPIVSELQAQNRGFAEKFEQRENWNNEVTEKVKAYDAGLLELKTLREEAANLRAEYLKGNRPVSGGDTPEDVATRQHQDVFLKAMRFGHRSLDFNESKFVQDIHNRSLSGTKDTFGGFLVPKVWNASVLMKAYDLAAIRPAATVQQTERDIVYPSISKPITAWGIANEKIAEGNLTSGQHELKLKFLTALFKIDVDTLSDSQYDLWGALADGTAKSIAQMEDSGFAIGDSGNEPSGIFVNTDVQTGYVASGVAAALSDGAAAATDGFTLIINTMAALNSAYKENAAWGFNSTTEGLMRLFHSTVGKEYFTTIWQPPSNVGDPTTLMGKPILRIEAAPDVAANAFPIVYGDFSNYQIADKGGIIIQRQDELYSRTNEIGFLIRKRVGGIPTLATESWVAVKVATS